MVAHAGFKDSQPLGRYPAAQGVRTKSSQGYGKGSQDRPYREE
jgi:hypothetical protein